MNRPDENEWLMSVKTEFLEARASRMRQRDDVYPRSVKKVVSEYLESQAGGQPKKEN